MNPSPTRLTLDETNFPLKLSQFGHFFLFFLVALVTIFARLKFSKRFRFLSFLVPKLFSPLFPHRVGLVQVKLSRQLDLYNSLLAR